MLYAIVAEDIENSAERRQATRPKHMAYLRELIDAGRVLIAGPFPAIDSPDPGPAGMTGSLIVAEFDSIEDARAWAAADPYSTEGVFRTVSVKPFLKVVP